ncbi:MAG: hypothetical protein ABI910_18025 [Gemmatimonadota bacterium]
MSVTPHLAPRLFLVLAACSLVASCDERRDHNAEVAAGATIDSNAPVAATSSVGATVGAASAGVVEAPTQPVTTVAAAAHSKPTFAEGADGSVSMRTRNGSMVMSLRHDSVVVAFSDSMRLAIQREMKSSMKEDAEADSENSAIGQMIKGVVKSTVTGAMREVFEKSRGFPVSSLRDVSYESGAIEFKFVRKPTWNFEHINSDDEPLLEQFYPADAARFVGALRALMKG